MPVNTCHLRLHVNEKKSKLGHSGNLPFVTAFIAVKQIPADMNFQVSESWEEFWGGRETKHQFVAAERWRHCGGHMQGTHCPTVRAWKKRDWTGQTLWACCHWATCHKTFLGLFCFHIQPVCHDGIANIIPCQVIKSLFFNLISQAVHLKHLLSFSNKASNVCHCILWPHHHPNHPKNVVFSPCITHISLTTGSLMGWRKDKSSF